MSQSQRITAPCGCYMVACGPVEITNMPSRQDMQVRGRPSVRPSFESRPRATAVQGYDPQATTSTPPIEPWNDPESTYYMPNVQRDCEGHAVLGPLARVRISNEQQNSPGPDGDLPSPTKVGSSAYPPRKTSPKRRPAQLELASDDENTSGAEGSSQKRRSPTSPRNRRSPGADDHEHTSGSEEASQKRRSPTSPRHRRSPGAERTSPTASNSQSQRFKSQQINDVPSEPAEQSEGEDEVVQSRR